jgi:hypothetical protein
VAKERVRLRVKEGGHNIPDNVIERRYIKDYIIFFMFSYPFVIMLCFLITLPNLLSNLTKSKNKPEEIIDVPIYDQLKSSYVRKENFKTKESHS